MDEYMQNISRFVLLCFFFSSPPTIPHNPSILYHLTSKSRWNSCSSSTSHFTPLSVSSTKFASWDGFSFSLINIIFCALQTLTWVHFLFHVILIIVLFPIYRGRRWVTEKLNKSSKAVVLNGVDLRTYTLYSYPALLPWDRCKNSLELQFSHLPVKEPNTYSARWGFKERRSKNES